MKFPKYLRKFISNHERLEVLPKDKTLRAVERVNQNEEDNTTRIMGYNGAPTNKFNKLIDENSTLSLRHTGFKGKDVDIADLPHWTWCEEKCQDWISEFATTYLRMNSWEGGELGQRFAGNGRLLYCTTKEGWVTLLGTEKRGALIYEFLVKASKEKGVVPPGVVISHQKSRE